MGEAMAAPWRHRRSTNDEDRGVNLFPISPERPRPPAWWRQRNYVDDHNNSPSAACHTSAGDTTSVEGAGSPSAAPIPSPSPCAAAFSFHKQSYSACTSLCNPPLLSITTSEIFFCRVITIHSCPQPYSFNFPPSIPTYIPSAGLPISTSFSTPLPRYRRCTALSPCLQLRTYTRTHVSLHLPAHTVPPHHLSNIPLLLGLGHIPDYSRSTPFQSLAPPFNVPCHHGRSLI